MSSSEGPSRKRKREETDRGPFILQPLLEDVPVTVDSDSPSAHITCVNYWDGNLYIGTSSAELLHFVSLPGSPQDGTELANYILASRLQLAPPPSSGGTSLPRGVQQILLLKRANRACVLANGTTTFYTLPELSPAYGNTKVSDCTWIGGQDLDVNETEGDAEVVMLCIKSKIRLVSIGDKARRVRDVEFPGCLASSRRGPLACVADAHSYALLDIENRQKIPLFPISSFDDDVGINVGGRAEEVPLRPAGPNIRNSLLGQPSSGGDGISRSAHSRASSLGNFVGSLGRTGQDSRPQSRGRSGVLTPDRGARTESPLQTASPVTPDQTSRSPARKPSPPPPLEKDLPPIPAEGSQVIQPSGVMLKPHIQSPLSSEFLLITGTSPDEPGVGIFVNYDGDVVRGTLQFSRYPNSIVIDGGESMTSSTPDLEKSDHDGYILAALTRATDKTEDSGIEIQRWDVGADAGATEGKDWLSLTKIDTGAIADDSGPLPPSPQVGLAATSSEIRVAFQQVGEKLRARRLHLFSGSNDQSASDAEVDSEDWEKTRIQQEDVFARRLGGTKTRVVVWAGSSIWWAVRNPTLLKLEALVSPPEASSMIALERNRLVNLFKHLQGWDARTETEYLSLQYIRQKISLIVFADFVVNPSAHSLKATEDVLISGNVDPRITLSMVHFLRKDIVEGSKGIWLHDGLITVINQYRNAVHKDAQNPNEEESIIDRPDQLNLLKRYLIFWRQRKGFGSISDEAEVFSTVDAALLHLLLYQDRQSIENRSSSPSSRAELYSIVDHSINCFDRAIELLEEFHRLYVLSRLYQSRRMARMVLATWKRIIEGEVDEGDELADGEREVLKYLTRVEDLSLVEEYGIWLAKRNPILGVQVFTDDKSKVKLPPNQVVQLLRLRAPDSVKVYLEHLVFGKKNLQYANDLISYYLDNVIAVLESSAKAREMLAQSYEAYRALQPPKPTYRQFLVENATSSSWWKERLRLLELLGGSHGVGFSYDVPSILARIEPFERFLVPESIILDGRQGRHQQALRLLTHGLGDYHTAISYCLMGGSSLFHPSAGSSDAQTLPSQENQAALFLYLFSEFLSIEVLDDRIEQTCELLNRFGSWFDVAYVLAHIPDSWSVQPLSGFLVGAIRNIVQDRNEALITKALSSAENIQTSAQFVEKCEAIGPQVQVAQPA